MVTQQAAAGAAVPETTQEAREPKEKTGGKAVDAIPKLPVEALPPVQESATPKSKSDDGKSLLTPRTAAR